jgi:hypothetical protein
MAPSQLELEEINDESLWDRHPEQALALAHETAQRVLQGDSAGSGDATARRLMAFVEEDGIDTVAELWAPAEPSSLPGALWRLVLIRHHLRERADVIADLVDRGAQRLSTIDPVVAGVTEPVSAEGILSLLDDILTGGFRGHLAPALLRAASLAKLVSTGLLDWPEQEPSEANTAISALHWEELSRALRVSATREQQGKLR